MGQKRITQWSEDSWFVRVEVVGENEVESHTLLPHFGSVCIDARSSEPQAGMPAPLGGSGWPPPFLTNSPISTSGFEKASVSLRMTKVGNCRRSALFNVMG